MIRILFLALLAAQLPAQNELWIDLSGDWRTIENDNLAYASPGFDDSAWNTLQVPQRKRQNADWRWLRRTIQLPAGVDRGQLCISVGTIFDVFEIYANGQRIGASSSLQSFEKTTLPRPMTFAIPAEALASGGDSVLIALRIRARVFSYPPSWRLPDMGPWVLSSSSVAPFDAAEKQMALNFQRYSLSLLFALSILFCGGLSLVGWRAEPSRKDLFWFSLLAAAKALGTLYTYIIMADSTSTPWNAEGFHWQYIVSHLDSPLVAFLALAILGIESRWLRWLLAIFCLPAPIAALLHAPISSTIALNTWNLQFGPAVAVLAICWMWWRQRHTHLPVEEHLLRAAVLLPAMNTANNFLARLVGGSTNMGRTLGEFYLSYDLSFWLLVCGLMVVLLLRRLAAARQESQRLAGEIEAARAVQQLLLPAQQAVASAFAIEAVYEPAQEVGGDFYWTRVLPDGGLLLAVGDVSGKGLKAAMLVSVTVGILRNEKSNSPAAILGALNEGLVGHTGGGFVTCCCARFDISGGVTIANAGHPSPYCDGLELEPPAGLPVGISAGIEYEELVLTGRKFTFVSDGVVEAANASGELFGFERTREISSKSARQIADAAKQWGQNDDITVVTVALAE